MTTLISIDSAEHYVWGDGCDGWHLVKEVGLLSVIQERMPPGTAEVRHYHVRSRQFFYVLSGEATMVLADRTEILRPQMGIEVPPGHPHQMRNDSGEALEFLVISAPPSHGDRVASD